MESHTNQLGFSALLIIILLFVAGAVGFAGWRVFSADKQNTGSEQSQTQNTTKQDDQTPVLQNFGINITDGVTVSTDALRDLSRGFKGFYGFGEILPPDNKRANPNFEFSSVKATAPIIAAIDGEVVHIENQSESNDSEVFLRTSTNSVWTVAYDHLTNIKVKKGDKVKAGDQLGNAAVQNNGLYRFELQVTKEEKGVTTHHCPTALLVDSKKISISSELKTMMEQ